jgi:uncharacterized protein YvpB
MKYVLMVMIAMMLAASAKPVSAEMVVMLGSNQMVLDKELKVISDRVFIQNQTTMVPLRPLAEMLGAVVSWDLKTNTIHMDSDLNHLQLQLNSNKMIKNGEQILLTENVMSKKGSAFGPVRELAEAFGTYVSYDQGVVGVSSLEQAMDLLGSKEVLKKGYQFALEQKNEVLDLYATSDQAKKAALGLKNASVVDRDLKKEIWSNKQAYTVYQYDSLLDSFANYLDAVTFANRYKSSSIRTKGVTVWTFNKVQSANVKGVKNILQMPDLPRGCEVTSLAIVLQFLGIKADKNTLAKQVKKDPTPRTVRNGETYFGNPYDGFVGDMYSFNKPGLGVYHAPIAELAKQYATNVVDMTGSDFEDVLYPITQGKPVWIIHNVMFDTVPKSAWQTWHTPTGTIQITRKEHSVVIVGFDKDHVFIKDPMGLVNTVNRQAFERGWNQMGKQAVAVY